MAFIQKRGNSYYLVHNVRKQGRVQQVQLADLGRRPRISDKTIQGVQARHPLVRINWNRLREQASEKLTQQVEMSDDARLLFETLARAFSKVDPPEAGRVAQRGAVAADRQVQ
jgi:hypothetical protein